MNNVVDLKSTDKNITKIFEKNKDEFSILSPLLDVKDKIEEMLTLWTENKKSSRQASGY